MESSDGNILISTITGVALLGVLSLAVSSVGGPSIRIKALHRESERFTYFLDEVVTRSSYSLEPVLLSLSAGTVRSEAPAITPQTFTPRQGLNLHISGSSPESPREVRCGRSCSPTTYVLTGEGIPRQCTTTLSLRCRVRTSCSTRRGLL